MLMINIKTITLTYDFSISYAQSLVQKIVAFRNTRSGAETFDRLEERKGNIR